MSKHKKNQKNRTKISNTTKKRRIHSSYTPEKKRDIFLACFWRYGYWGCLTVIIGKYGTSDNILILLGLGCIIFSIYSIVIQRIPARHFLLGMLESSHAKMQLAGSGYNQNILEEWRRENRKVAGIFFFLGAIAVIMA